MGVFLKFMDQIVGILPAWVALLETTLGKDHPAVTQMRDASDQMQAAHQTASAAVAGQ